MGIPMNPYHIHANMGYDLMLQRMNELSGISYEILFSSNCEIDYNVVIVLKVTKHP